MKLTLTQKPGNPAIELRLDPYIGSDLKEEPFTSQDTSMLPMFAARCIIEGIDTKRMSEDAAKLQVKQYIDTLKQIIDAYIAVSYGKDPAENVPHSASDFALGIQKQQILLAGRMAAAKEWICTHTPYESIQEFAKEEGKSFSCPLFARHGNDLMLSFHGQNNHFIELFSRDLLESDPEGFRALTEKTYDLSSTLFDLVSFDKKNAFRTRFSSERSFRAEIVRQLRR